MNKKSTEILVGSFVLLGLVGLVFLALRAANLGSFGGGDSYALTAYFDNIGGLKVRAPVRSAGVTVGRVASITLDPKRYQGLVRLEIERGVQFPLRLVGAHPHLGAARRPVRRHRTGCRREIVRGRRHDQADTIRRGAREPDQPVSLQPGGRGTIVGGQRSQAMTRRMPSLAVRCATLAMVLVLAGCTTFQAARGGPGQRLDPWENWNRKVFNFNEDVDRTVLRPVATVYSNVVPQVVRRGVGNFFANFADAWSAVNNFLQFKITAGFEDLTRVGANTLFGLFGVLDVASEMGIDHKYEDFGQTLGRYGVGAGAYVVLPLFGPSTVRDAASLPVDRLASPSNLIDGAPTGWGLGLLQVINTRSNLLGASRVLDDISLDKYTFVRDAYLQRRRSLVFDGDAPETPQAPEAAASAAPGAAAGTVVPPTQAAPSAPPASAPRR
jgi:phospholipid-binding lipoprotein MlaA